jgi:hypothetical protein
MTSEVFVSGLRDALPEAFADCDVDEFIDEDGALAYPALSHALSWLADHALARDGWGLRRSVLVRTEAEDAMRRFWRFIETAAADEPGDLDVETLVWIECFEHDDWDVATAFMGPATRALRDG